jgi:hypothetical protein
MLLQWGDRAGLIRSSGHGAWRLAFTLGERADSLRRAAGPGRRSRALVAGVPMSGLHVEHPRDSHEPDEDLQDAELQEEIELVSDLVVAASGSDTALTQAQIDEALGLRP